MSDVGTESDLELFPVANLFSGWCVTDRVDLT